MIYVVNSFSLNMLGEEAEQILVAKPIGLLEAAELLDSAERIVSAVPHANIANLVSKELGVNLRAGKASVSLREGDTLLVAQPDGDYRDPDLTYWLVRVDAVSKKRS